MSTTIEESIVSVLDDHVERAISTVQQLRANKLELEAEVARLQNVVLERDRRIQELEGDLEFERLASSEERADIQERLAGLMAVLEPSETSSEGVVDFEEATEAHEATPEHAAEDAIGFETETEAHETHEPEASAAPKVFSGL